MAKLDAMTVDLRLRIQEEVHCRPELAQFVRIMEGKLCATDYKGNIDNIDMPWLYRKLKEEMDELATEIGAALGNRTKENKVKWHRIAMEAADVANVAFLIATMAHDVGTKEYADRAAKETGR